MHEASKQRNASAAKAGKSATAVESQRLSLRKPVKRTKRNETLAYNKIGCESVSGNRDKNVIRAE